MSAKTKNERHGGKPWHPEILETIEHHLYVVGMADVDAGLVEMYADKMFLTNNLFPPDRDVVDVLARFILALHSGVQSRRNNSIESHVHALNEFFRGVVSAEQRLPRETDGRGGSVTDEQYRRCLGIMVKIYDGDIARLDRTVEIMERNFVGFKGFMERARAAGAGTTKKIR